MGSLFQGHAIGGIITAVFNIVSIASTGSKNKASPSESAFFCFLAATIFIAVDILALILMTTTKFYKVCAIAILFIFHKYFLLTHILYYNFQLNFLNSYTPV